MRTEAPSITADIAIDCDERVVGLKLQTSSFELNLMLTSDDVLRLKGCLLPKPPDEHCLLAGTCFGATTFWSQTDSKYLGVTIGHNDVTWDAGFWMPLSSFDDILALLADTAREL